MDMQKKTHRQRHYIARLYRFGQVLKHISLSHFRVDELPAITVIMREIHTLQQKDVFPPTHLTLACESAMTIIEKSIERIFAPQK